MVRTHQVGSRDVGEHRTTQGYDELQLLNYCKGYILDLVLDQNDNSGAMVVEEIENLKKVKMSVEAYGGDPHLVRDGGMLCAEGGDDAIDHLQGWGEQLMIPLDGRRQKCILV